MSSIRHKTSWKLHTILRHISIRQPRNAFIQIFVRKKILKWWFQDLLLWHAFRYNVNSLKVWFNTVETLSTSFPCENTPFSIPDISDTKSTSPLRSMFFRVNIEKPGTSMKLKECLMVYINDKKNFYSVSSFMKEYSPFSINWFWKGPRLF